MLEFEQNTSTMAREESRKEKNRKNNRSGWFSSLSEETRHSIFGIGFLVVGIFVLLSTWNRSGIVGAFFHKWLLFLLGIGFYVLPVACFLLAASFFRSRTPTLVLPSVLGGALFLVASLGLFSLFKDAGGVIGGLVASPLIRLFDVYVSGVILFASLVISITLIFNTGIASPFAQLARFLGMFIPNMSRRAPEPRVTGMSREEEASEEFEEDEDPIITKEKEKPIRIERADNREKPKKLDADDATRMIELTNPVRQKPYVPPPLSILSGDSGKAGAPDIKGNAGIIQRTLANFGISVEVDEITIGPSVTRYAIKPAEGVKLSRIVGLQNDLSLALAAHPIRIEAPIPGKSLVGIEVPNVSRATVGLANLLSTEEYSNSRKPLLFPLGKGVSGAAAYADLAKLPHLLIAGATGSGKSVTIHAIITSLLYRNSPENLRFIMVDPKRVELTLYNKIPHLLTPVITDSKKAILSLKWAAKEMDRRYDILETESVRDIHSYHANIVEPAYKKFREGKGSAEALPEPMPYIVVVIDELADIMATYPRELEAGIVRIAQMSRAVGIHLVLSTQRPSVNVITGLIKANIPGRIALQVASQIDSRTILDQGGAEKLLGAGDMLALFGEKSQPERIQSAFVSEGEVKKTVKFLADEYQDEVPDNIELVPQSETGGGSLIDIMNGDVTTEEDDELYEEALRHVREAGKASTSYLQRRLGIGYARAARLIDILEDRGVIGPGDGAKPREVLIPSESGMSGGDENTGEENRSV